MEAYSILLLVELAMPRSIAARAVRSYRTVSPLPDKSGGLFSVALVVGSRPPGVTWHHVLWSSDFPPPWWYVLPHLPKQRLSG